jgi:hypothetical protein
VRGWPAVRGNPLARWLLAVVAAHAAFVALTHADWDGRYLAHVLPLLYVFSGVGLARSLAAHRASDVGVGS